MEQPSIVQREGFHFVGISTTTSNEAEKEGNGKIPALWGKYYDGKTDKKVECPTLALYSDYENGAAASYSFSIGSQVDKIDQPNAGTTAVSIPSQRYAVFTTEKGKLSEVVPQAWGFIWQWFTQSQEERSFTYDFESYDERSLNANDAVVDIYVAIK